MSDLMLEIISDSLAVDSSLLLDVGTHPNQPKN